MAVTVSIDEPRGKAVACAITGRSILPGEPAVKITKTTWLKNFTAWVKWQEWAELVDRLDDEYQTALVAKEYRSPS